MTMLRQHYLPLFLSFFPLAILLGVTMAFRALPAVAGQLPAMEEESRYFADVGEYLQSDLFRDSGRRCGTKVIEGGYRDEQQAESTAHCTRALTSIQNEYFPTLVYTIPIWWHVIYHSNGAGNIPESVIVAQMEVLNEDFRAMAGTMGSDSFDVMIRFELQGITRTQNDTWYADNDEIGYKETLGLNPSLYLNIYSNNTGYLGYAYFPQDNVGVYDGIVMQWGAVGGRNNGYGTYNQGRTLVHEMGHYLGLYHTFEDGAGCGNTYSSGDRIVDTNAEETPHFGCSQTYSCSTADPIQNYMSYTDDDCMHQFSREQANRAVCSLVNYRPDLYSVSGEGGGEDEIKNFPWPLFLQIFIKAPQSKSL